MKVKLANKATMLKTLRLCGLTACFAVTQLCISAPLTDGDEPIKVQASKMTYDQAKSMTILEGNVHVEQGTIKINAQRVDIIQGADGFSSVKATGNPVNFEGRSAKTNRQVKGWAHTITYTEKSEEVVMSGNAKLVSEKDEIQAQTIRYFRKTGQYFADGANKPVFAIIQPRKKIVK